MREKIPNNKLEALMDFLPYIPAYKALLELAAEERRFVAEATKTENSEQFGAFFSDQPRYKLILTPYGMIDSIGIPWEPWMDLVSPKIIYGLSYALEIGSGTLNAKGYTFSMGKENLILRIEEKTVTTENVTGEGFFCALFFEDLQNSRVSYEFDVIVTSQTDSISGGGDEKLTYGV
jgi:hypothetical protein